MIEIPQRLLGNREPFFVCSRSVLSEQVGKIRKLGLEVFYAVKTNQEMQILEELHRLGTGFLASNPKDFISVSATGARPDKIIYYARGLTRPLAEWLIENGCRNFVVESLPAFDNLLPLVDNGFSILARMRANGVRNKYSGEYVPGLEAGEVRAINAKCRKLGITTGVLHHSSSQVDDLDAWNKKFKELAGLGGMDIIDLGGGIPISYGSGNHDKIFEEIKNGIKKLNAMRVIIEPGRFIAGPACSLVARVEVVDGSNAVLNCSVYNTHIDTIIADVVLPCRALKKGPQAKYRLLGSSLCNLDVFNKGAVLPKLAEGDVVVFDNAGAYNFSSEFGSGIKTYMVG